MRIDGGEVRRVRIPSDEMRGRNGASSMTRDFEKKSIIQDMLKCPWEGISNR